MEGNRIRNNISGTKLQWNNFGAFAYKLWNNNLYKIGTSHFQSASSGTLIYHPLIYGCFLNLEGDVRFIRQLNLCLPLFIMEHTMAFFSLLFYYSTKSRSLQRCGCDFGIPLILINTTGFVTLHWIWTNSYLDSKSKIQSKYSFSI